MEKHLTEALVLTLLGILYVMTHGLFTLGEIRNLLKERRKEK